MDEISDKINQIISRIRDIHSEKKREITISNIAGCLRASYYRATMGKEVSEKMIMGSENHAFFQRHLKDEMARDGYTCYDEYELKYGKIRGRADMVCEGDDDGIVFEFKFTSVPYKSNPFYPFWYRQLQYYVAVAEKTRERKWIGVLIASAFDLSSWLIDVVNVEDPDAVLDMANERYEQLAKAFEFNNPPLPEKGKWCDLCSFRNYCFNQKLV